MFALRLALITSIIVLAAGSAARSWEIGLDWQIPFLPKASASNSPLLDAQPLRSTHTQMTDPDAFQSASDEGKQPASASCISTKSVVCSRDGKLLPSVIKLTDYRGIAAE